MMRYMIMDMLGDLLRDERGLEVEGGLCAKCWNSAVKEDQTLC